MQHQRCEISGQQGDWTFTCATIPPLVRIVADAEVPRWSRCGFMDYLKHCPCMCVVSSKDFKKEYVRIRVMKLCGNANLFRLFSVGFGILALAVLLRVVFQHPEEYAVGERFVIDEIVFPTGFYVFHFKPITLFSIFSFLYWIFGLEGWEKQLKALPISVKRTVFIFFALVTFVFGYEAIQNFLQWTSFYILYQGNIDLLHHQLNPAMPKPVNFNFISKLFTMFVAGSLYSMYFFHRLEKD